MFNFLVAAGGWSGRRDDVALGRVYIDQTQELQWKVGGLPNFDLMRTLPAIFAPETYGDGTGQVARVGEIISTRIQIGRAHV